METEMLELLDDWQEARRRLPKITKRRFFIDVAFDVMEFTQNQLFIWLRDKI